MEARGLERKFESENRPAGGLQQTGQTELGNKLNSPHWIPGVWMEGWIHACPVNCRPLTFPYEMKVSVPAAPV
ncbi:hypothetical protein RRG08_009847 [Elysia crispata]|uniref:Uncharacterized protein n=1 Tax=Elysia crispata TaxID=231223 RepID=A0AAE0Z447_9GAST|nr:hypothetical protein RRG08_009847 [Elysia crispata]